MSHNKEDIISINNYDDKSVEYINLPHIGWLKPCYYCLITTGKYVIINYRMIKFKLYVCDTCNKKHQTHLTLLLCDFLNKTYFNYL